MTYLALVRYSKPSANKVSIIPIYAAIIKEINTTTAVRRIVCSRVGHDTFLSSPIMSAASGATLFAIGYLLYHVILAYAGIQGLLVSLVTKKFVSCATRIL